LIRGAFFDLGCATAGALFPRQDGRSYQRFRLLQSLTMMHPSRAATNTRLSSRGCVVYTLASAEEFLQSTHFNDMSCVIADVQMPVMCDVELLTTMRAQGYRVPFIFITACPDESVRARVLNAGAICFLEALRRTYFDRLPRRRLGRTAQRRRHLILRAASASGRKRRGCSYPTLDDHKWCSSACWRPLAAPLLSPEEAEEFCTAPDTPKPKFEGEFLLKEFRRR
jgi:CheY-like chemotaxis protein